MTLSLLLALAATPVAPLARDAHLVQRYRIEAARSEVGFHGDSTLHAFTGRTRALSGEVRTVLEDPQAFTAGWVRAEAASFDTQEKDRDEKMREHLDVEHFPYVDFLLTGASGALEAGRGRLQVRGRFRIHGVERERELALDFAPEDGGLRAKGSLVFPMSEHGIAPPRVAVITVDDALEVFVDLLLVPVPGDLVTATVYRASVLERVEPVGGEALELQREERLLVHGERVEWLRPASGTWISLAGPGARAFDLSGDATRAAPGPSEALFDEARERKERLEQKLADLPAARRPRTVKRTIEELEAGLALAPPPGEARVERGETVSITLGDEVWIEASGSVGPEPIGRALTAFEGLPGSVTRALGEIEGVPRRLVVRTAVPTGVRTFTIEFAAPAQESVPAWALAPETWIGVAGVGAGERP